ncbi:MAG: DUF4926 domain-containing protein [Gemmatimonadaceae bacterium]
MTDATYHELDAVVLVRDRPDAGLRAGDLGTVVQLYAPDAFDVEFITASGHTRALLRLRQTDVRPAGDHDRLAVRAEPGVGRTA